MNKILLLLLACVMSSAPAYITGKIDAKIPFKPCFEIIISQGTQINQKVYTIAGSSITIWTFNHDNRWPYNNIKLDDSTTWGKITPNREGFTFTPVAKYYKNYISTSTNISDQNFYATDTMAPSVVVDSPAIGDIIVLNSPQNNNITWHGIDNSETSMTRFYSVSYDNGKNFISICTLNKDIPCCNDLHYEWVSYTFNIVSDSCLIKIGVMDWDSNITYGYSGLFRIVDTIKPTVSVLSPNGGEKWFTGQTKNITWTASDNITLKSRSIYFSNNNGTNWYLMDSVSGNTGTWSWLLSCLPSNQYKVKIKVFDQSENSQEDISDNVFEIIDTATIDTTKPVVKIIFPTAGNVLTLGNSYNIVWSATDNKGVVSRTIYRRWNGPSWVLMDSSITNTGTWSWYIPNGIDLLQFELRITAYDSLRNSATDYSGMFDIKDLTPPIVSVKHPQKGKIYVYSARINFSAKYFCSSPNDTDKWNRIVSRSLYYSLDGGNSYTFIDSMTDTTQYVFYEYQWYSKSLASDQAKIRVYVYDSKGNQGVGYSDSLFTVSPPVSVQLNIFPKKFGVSILNGAFKIDMEKAGKVSISLYDFKGRRVWVREEMLSIGSHRIDRGSLASGLYILKIVRADKIIMRKIR